MKEDKRENLTIAGLPEIPPSTKPAAEPIRQQLNELRDQPGWSTNKLASRLGVSASVVSQYLNLDETGKLRPEGNKYPGDVAALERRVVDLIRNESRRKASGVDNADCEISQAVKAALEYIRKTVDVGIIVGEAGQGKSRALELYVADNPTAVLCSVRSWTCDRSAIEAALFEAIGRTGYDNRTRRSVYIVNKLHGSDRVIILDDAHKLTRPALQWVFDLHDETHCPIALLGTFDLEDKVKDDAQRFSRVGLRFELKPENPRDLIQHLIKQLCPGIDGELSELCDLCDQVARHHGHFRSVHKQLKVTTELKLSTPKLSWCAAFRQAHSLLVREYKLG
jgi:DNA transposition AAA+ family ATPase